MFYGLVWFCFKHHQSIIYLSVYMHSFQLRWEYNLRIYDLSSTPFPFSVVSDWRWYEGNVDYFLFFTQVLSLCSSHLLREGLMNTTHTSQDRWSRGNREQKGHEFHSSFSKEHCAFFFSRFVEVATFIFPPQVFCIHGSFALVCLPEHCHEDAVLWNILPGWCTMLSGQNVADRQLPRTISAQFSLLSAVLQTPPIKRSVH